MADTIDGSKPPITSGTGNTDADADGLLGFARGIEAQISGDTGAPLLIDEEYAAAIVRVVEEKQDQASQIEDRLENMIEAQTARLQQMQAQPPKMLSSTATRAKWQAQVVQAQATIQLLQSRLETVREIRDGMSVHGSKIEELAAVKLAHREPKLADDFAELQEARRLHEIHIRQQQVKQNSLSRGALTQTGPTLSMSLSQTRPT